MTVIVAPDHLKTDDTVNGVALLPPRLGESRSRSSSGQHVSVQRDRSLER